MTIILEKTYSQHDQLIFAQLSKDVNPFHVDPVIARRLISGRQVVHGINILLTALDVLYEKFGLNQEIGRIQADFRVAINIDEMARFELKELTECFASIVVFVGLIKCASFKLYFLHDNSQKLSPYEKDESINQDYSNLEIPLNLELGKINGFKGSVDYSNSPNFSHLYKNISALKGGHFCSFFLGLSYLVGMVCPGLNSIFIGLDVTAYDLNVLVDHNKMFFEVSQVDDRVGKSTINVFSDILSGKIYTMIRPKPTKQLSYQEVKPYLSLDEFRGSKSLVIGGSRGLGELVSKVLAAGGGNVSLTYFKGKIEAENIISEICRESNISHSTVELDLLHLDRYGLRKILEDINFLYYFATPRIVKKNSQVFSIDRYSEFSQYYLDSFYKICTEIEINAKNTVYVYYPSSIYVEDHPYGLTEYAMVKSAAEILISRINASFKNIKIVSTRLPKLITDQTASIFVENSSKNLPYLLHEVRNLYNLWDNDVNRKS